MAFLFPLLSSTKFISLNLLSRPLNPTPLHRWLPLLGFQDLQFCD
ncbi:hypothetical protein CCACVL1_01735 [Corchorus capsularis]|uniref:Uncharacterized protein n=1 Tax=Corchorus capsularis TaxID=210143 RepID=A0A1R3KG20_COCAP|nr:hypothetical protein CCACVL1_01735 [Corchorus capsularis]